MRIIKFLAGATFSTLTLLRLIKQEREAPLSIRVVGVPERTSVTVCLVKTDLTHEEKADAQAKWEKILKRRVRIKESHLPYHIKDPVIQDLVRASPTVIVLYATYDQYEEVCALRNQIALSTMLNRVRIVNEFDDQQLDTSPPKEYSDDRVSIALCERRETVALPS